MHGFGVKHLPNQQASQSPSIYNIIVKDTSNWLRCLLPFNDVYGICYDGLVVLCGNCYNALLLLYGSMSIIRAIKNIGCALYAYPTSICLLFYVAYLIASFSNSSISYLSFRYLLISTLAGSEYESLSDSILKSPVISSYFAVMSS